MKSSGYLILNYLNYLYYLNYLNYLGTFPDNSNPPAPACQGHQAAKHIVTVTGHRFSYIKSVLVLTGHQSTDIIRSQVCQTGVL